MFKSVIHATVCTTALLLAGSAGATGELELAAESAVPAIPENAVSRAAFTREVLNREPVEELETLTVGDGEVYFFTELSGLHGQTITHRWEFGGEVKAEIPFEVRGPRWRVFSSKRLHPGWIGTWTVVVVDAAGRELSREHLDYVPTAEPEGPASPVPAAPAEEADTP